MIPYSPSDHYLESIQALRNLVFNYLISLVPILANIPQIMTEEVRSAVPRVKWTNHETDALVDYFHEHRSEGAQGGKFKDTTYNAAAMHIQPLYVSGKPKDGKSIKTKWNAVSPLYWISQIIG